MSKGRSSGSDELIGLMFLIAMGYYAWTWFPSFPPWGDSTTLDIQANMSLITSAASIFRLDYSKIRTVPRFAGSVYLYVPYKSFEDIPVPDRDIQIKALIKGFCLTEDNSFSRVVIRDIQSDEVIITRACFMAK